ncbi:Isotrichodermin C-15 hydroxylase [Elsinoe australis]|uniref:Isotrichodermin C-15 hydroxylase n=1 Tax=Elsinoe australis TaxID=40998 RepID=A0A2P8AG11_9PEZI|nr:Isotrichodermin C-15 hydroxylase [Elsinoe australis]
MAKITFFLNSIKEYGLIRPLLFSLPLLFILYHIVKAFLSPLRNVPGPLLARFTKFWYLKSVWRGDFEKTNIALHDKLGPVVRIAPNQYSIDDPEAIRIIYGHGTAFVKSDWYYASGNAHPDINDLFTDRNPKRHSELRRKVANLYSMTSLLHLEPFVTTCTDLLVGHFDRMAETNETINLQHWLQCYAFDTIGMITFAKRFGFLDEGKDMGGLLHALHNYLIYAANVGVYSWLHSYLSGALNWLPGHGMGYLIGFTAENIQERLSKPGSEKRTEQEGDDFLSKMLREPEKFQKEMFGTCLTNVGAGSDTTSVSLSGILYHLIKNPDKMTKLRAEIDAKASQGDLSPLTTYAQAQSLPYLQACIKEGLRMHPATGLPLMRVVPSGGATIAGHYFPSGSVVGVNSWVAHRNRQIFGADADRFVPERWLESGERSGRMERYFMSFGAGSRTCIGKNISLLEIGKVVPELVRRFDFELCRPGRELRTENNWFVKQMDMEVRVRVRKTG